MKWLFTIFLSPLFASAQTIHFEDENIIYQGTLVVPGVRDVDLPAQFARVLESQLEKKDLQINASTGANQWQVRGAMKLNSPYHIIRKVRFTLQLAADGDAYRYTIDSVSVEERRRGGKTEVQKSEELLDSMEETGAAGQEAEKLLNEIDMRFQKLIALLQSAAQGRYKN